MDSNGGTLRSGLGKKTTPASDILIRTGNVNLWEGGFRKVSAIFPHQNYDPQRTDNDAALIKLAQLISESSGPVGAIPVLQNSAEMHPGPAVSIGWGLMEGSKIPGVLMETEIDVVSNGTCNAGFAEQTRRDLGGFFLLSMGASNCTAGWLSGDERKSGANDEQRHSDGGD